MLKYIAYFTFTEQGRRNIMQLGSIEQAQSRAMFWERVGIKALGYYWTTGKYDIVAVVEVEDESKVLGPLLRVAMEGNMTYELVRAYDVQEIAQVLGAMGPITHVTPQLGAPTP